jgi:bacterioferritin-associated ferredoxin
MLVCHCNVITDREIIRIIKDFLKEDPWQIIVPARSIANSTSAANARAACRMWWT